MARSNLGFFAALLQFGACVRFNHQVSDRSPIGTTGAAKTIAGIPVYNYCAAGSDSCAGFVPDQWVLLLKAGRNVSSFSHICTGGALACRLKGTTTGIPFALVKASENNLSKALELYSDQFSFIEPNLKVRAIIDVQVSVANAPTRTWGLERIGVQGQRFRGKGVSVYVLDTGIFAEHSDFGGRAFAVLDMTIDDGDAVDCLDGSRPCGRDAQGHGTHCAGSAAGGFYGVAPDANVYGIKVLGDGGSGTMAGVLGGMDWVATSSRRPAVASMSLGGSGQHHAEHVAVEAMSNSGVTVIVAAGNENSDACGFSPSFSPAAFTVGASTPTDARASFSNFGSCVNIWAPGENIQSLGLESENSTDIMSGTSMACPHVAGGAALVLEEDPTRSAADVKAELTRTALGSVLSGLKRVDTNDLLFVGEPRPKPSTTTVIPGSCPDGSMANEIGDCRCPDPLICRQPFNYWGMIMYKDCSFSGGESKVFYDWTCDDCKCVPDRRY